MRARLKRERGKHQLLSSVILANVRSVHNKTDELQANATYMYEYRTAAILAFTETWLNSNDRDSSLYIDGFGTPTRFDRDSQLTGKRERLYTADVELLAVSLCPFYLPREFPQLFFVLVYIHPKAKASAASDHIMSTLNRFELISLDSPKFVLGDFNHCSADQNFLKGFHQYVTCTTHMGKTLDKCYGSVPNAYKSVALPPLGSADHAAILLAPAYLPVVRRAEKVVKTIKQWTSDSVERLQGCFETTYWMNLIAPSSNINEQVDTVTPYISFCVCYAPG